VTPESADPVQPLSPGQQGCPGSPTSQVCAPRCPYSWIPRSRPLQGLQDPNSLQSPSRTLRLSGRPRDAPRSSLPRSSPESSRSSHAPPPPAPRRPHAGSTPWAAGWAPASWSWPSGPCCLAEPSQWPSAAPGSPRRRLPRPTCGDPALTGRLPPLIGWNCCPSLQGPASPSRGFPAPSGAALLASLSWPLRVSGVP
jgi:hypothetical protein